MTRRILVHALVIATFEGNFLVSIIRNPELDETVLSGFIGALNMFGQQTLGKVGDISISGLGINLLVIHKWGLHVIAIIDSDLPELNFREGCEAALDAFYDRYVQKLENWGGRLRIFSDFKPFLEGQIQGYFAKLKEFKKDQPDFFETEYNGQKQSTPAQLINALQNDVKIYQDANESLHNRIKGLEKENEELKRKLAL